MTESLPKPRGLHWFALTLLVISVCINYADRGNLGVAARSLELELHLGKDQLGQLLGAFSLTYSFSQLIAGKLLDRWNVNWLYALAFFLWSSATAATGLANTFGQIMVLRLMLGIGESIAYPAYSKVIVTSSRKRCAVRRMPSLMQGSKLGPFLGVLLGVKMVQWFDWRGMFFVIGAASLLWLIPWCAVAPKLPGKIVSKTQLSTWSASYKQLLTSRCLWGTAIGLFGGNYAWYFLLNWLPYYFETDRHYTKDKLAFMGSLPFLAVAIASMCFGLVADWFIRRGRDAGRVRQICACTGLSGCCVLMLSAALAREVFHLQHPHGSGLHFDGYYGLRTIGPLHNFWPVGDSGQMDWFAELYWQPSRAWPGHSSVVMPSRPLIILCPPLPLPADYWCCAVLSYWFIVGKPAQVFSNPHANSFEQPETIEKPDGIPLPRHS